MARSQVTEPINLNKARKARDKAQKTARSAENRIKFGRTKAERDLERSRKEKSARDTDAHQRED